jgi:hypothetical protein
MGYLVVPAAATVRLVPRGTIAISPFGIVAGGGTWPALAVSLVVALVLGLAAWRLHAATLPSPKKEGHRVAWKWPSAWTLSSAWLPSAPDWTRFLLWGAFGIAVFNVLTRP